MTLKEFHDHISSFPENTQFRYGISEPFAWRGVYEEVAFAITRVPMHREQVLARIGMAYTGTFVGYKGGQYHYGDLTPVNFEEDIRSYTEKRYVVNLIKEIAGTEVQPDIDMRLVTLAFA